MRITNKNGRIINSLFEWEQAFVEVDSSEHWREGRSAHSLGYYFTYPNIEYSEGIKKITSLLLALDIEGVQLTHAEIEHESRFDKFRGNGRMQDMTIWAESNSGPLVIEIEAKVDETFNVNLQEAYENALKVREKKPNSKAVDRIINLMEKLYKESTIDSHKEIRYQLLYYLYGSVKDALKINGTAILPVMVFHTKDFDKQTGEDNKADYIRFMKSVGFQTEQVGDILLFRGEVEDTKVYSAYIEIDL